MSFPMRFRDVLRVSKARRGRLPLLAAGAVALGAVGLAGAFSPGATDSGSRQAQWIPDWENSAEFELVASHSPVRRGDVMELAVVAELADGYHLYGPEESPPSATVVEFIPGRDFVGGEPRYPEPIRRDLSGLGEYDLYEGRVAIRIPVTATLEETGWGRRAEAAVLVRYQLCTDNACSAPTRTTLELVLPTGAEGAEIEELHADIFDHR